MIQFKSFVSLVEEMRLKQKMYFMERTHNHLQKAKMLERRVDMSICALRQQFNSDGAEQLSLTFPD